MHKHIKNTQTLGHPTVPLSPLGYEGPWYLVFFVISLYLFFVFFAYCYVSTPAMTHDIEYQKYTQIIKIQKNIKKVLEYNGYKDSWARNRDPEPLGCSEGSWYLVCFVYLLLYFYFFLYIFACFCVSTRAMGFEIEY